MSISNRHPVNQFVAGKSEPMSDQRLARVGYKSTTKNPAKFPSVCASVPYIEEFTEDQFKRLQPYIVQMLENAQDGIFRSMYESSDGTLEALGDDDISVDSCISFLEAESTGGRLTKEYLQGWFDSQMAGNLTVVIAEKLGFGGDSGPNEDQMVTIEKYLSGYRGMVVSLAGGKAMFQEPQIRGLLKAMEIVSVEDDTSVKLVNRLKGMLVKPKIEELLEL